MAFEIENGVLKKYRAEKGETEVVIPDSVTTIGDSAFEDCKNLTSVTIPDSVTTIGYRAFYECSSLTSVTIPDSVTTIGDLAFYECENLTSVTIPDSVTRIGKSAFEDCESLTSVTIPDSVTTIGYEAFYGCESLISVTMPDSVTTIGNRAFYGCERFTPVIKGIKFKADGEKLSKDFNEIIKIPETKDFSAKLYTPLKYAVIVGYYLQSGDADTEAFIKKSIKKIMTFLIDGDNVGAIIKLLETGKFVTAKNVTTFIDYANSLQKMEIQLRFMNYSHEHFKPQKPKLKL